ncbi:Ppx/GppA phosphatase family protein [Flavobacterium aquidurense]|uniref:Exopolyphosphatase n=1 Tax=Flavobacterium frigidimaris TaxID=262320 RepID=A0ABX4BPE3_FLAFR|nr:exopolyphosphatase [Flavobacterium frigidimaris]OXA78421.1 exopolyphosphatase [Flavobacterium frigidimaris]SDZ62929.1 Ppx/GppA phosphatase family protein [Flavobacterium aquidurense]
MKKCIALKVIIIFIFLISPSLISQELYAGIEIGSKGVKMSVINVQNIKKGKYEVVDFWTENVAIAKGIAVDKKLADNDIDTAFNVVVKNYTKLLKENKIEEKNIFIVVSSGVGMAENVDILLQRLYVFTNINVGIITAETEAKLLLKGCIPPKEYSNSLILDIGGGNTKGGYVEKFSEDDILIFYPVTLDLGTVTFTEKINKKAKTNSITEFNELLSAALPELREQTDHLYQQSPKIFNKDNIYMSGGAVWAFYTLYKGNGAIENFSPFEVKDVQAYNTMLETDYAKFEALAPQNKDVEKVLKTYSQKYLLAANSLLLTLLEKMPDIKSKKIYFTKQGQMAWLLSYIADSAKRAKNIH